MSGILLALTATFLLTIADALKKKLAASFEPLTVIFTTYSLSSILITIFAVTIGMPRVNDAPALAAHFLAGCALAITVEFLYLKALNSSEFSLAIPLKAFIPIFSLFFGLVFLGEVPSILALTGVACIVGGAYLLFAKRGKRGLLFPLMMLGSQPGARAMLLASFLLSILSVNQKQGSLLSEPVAYFAANLCVQALFFYLLARSRGVDVFAGFRQMPLVCLVCTLFWGSGLVMYYIAATQTLVVFVTGIAQLGALFSIVAAKLLFEEKGLERRMRAATMMVFGALMIVYAGQ
jgi:drug/metabolite transporter (DMT)-like permease